MVKPDASKDYYGILDLKPDATTDEIRKAYFKLGKKLKELLARYTLTLVFSESVASRSQSWQRGGGKRQISRYRSCE